jgi:AP2-associated kinase
MGNKNSSKASIVGKTIKIDQKLVKVKKKLTEGGFSFIFLVESVDRDRTPYVLKQMRVQVENENSKQSAERDTHMHATVIPPHPNIVTCVSHCKLPVGTNRVDYFILMEWCGGGSVFELMEARLLARNRLKNREVAEIFRDCCKAVAHLHSLTPPVAHRDLKIENLLHDDQHGTFKLCDFGSCTTQVIDCRIPLNRHERNRAEEVISKNTTLAYRAPEMVDLYSGKLINEKVDVWSLGK